MSQEKNASWLVKSSGRILGPFTKQQVDELLLQNDLVVLDEVSTPTLRWSYIRDVPAFSLVVEELRVRSLKSGEETATASLGNNTDTITKTQEKRSSFEEDLTAPLGFNSEDVVDAVYEDVADNSKASPPTAPQAFGMANDQRIRQQAQQKTRPLWLATAVILCAVVGFVLFKQFFAMPIQKVHRAVDHVASAHKYYQVGDFKKAADEFDKAYRLDPSNKSFYLPYALLLIRENGDTVLARRLLSQVTDSRAQSQKNLLLALADMEDEKWDKASEDFHEILKVSPANREALCNLAIVDLREHNPDEALQAIDRAANLEQLGGTMILVKAEALALHAQQLHILALLKPSLDLLTNYRRSHKDYQQEAGIFATYLSNQLRKKSQGLDDEGLEVLLDQDPENTALHLHDLWIESGYVHQRLFSYWCPELLKSYSDGPFKLSLSALCHLQSNDVAKARSEMETAVNRAPKNPLINSIYSYLLNKTGLQLEASTILGKATELNNMLPSQQRFQLPLILQARFNEKSGDWDGASQVWRKMIDQQPQSLVALTGLSEYYLHQHDSDSARRYYQQAMKISSSYKPLLSIGASLNGGIR